VSDLSYDGTVEEQWRVIWFPPDAPHRTFTGSEDAVRRKAEHEDVADWHPNIERREVIRKPWESA
jgi:hypothetical protein